VPESVKTIRSERIREFASTIALEYKERFLNSIVEVLVEESLNGISYGFTPNYLRVSFKGDIPINSIAKVKITSVNSNKMAGELLSFK